MPTPAPFAPVLAAPPLGDAAAAPPPTPWARGEGALPPEIARIAEGAVTLFKGGLMNPGQQTWYALDLERRCFLAVLRQAGDDPQAAAAPHPGGLLRRLQHALEAVHQARASAAQCQAFAALAHRLLACRDEADQPPEPLPQGPLRRTLVLLHAGQALALPQGAQARALRADIVRLIQQPLQARLLQE